MTQHPNGALIHRFIEEACHRGNLHAVDEIYAPDYICHDCNRPMEIRGGAGIRQLVAILRGACPDLRITIEDQVAAGDRLATRYTARGTHLGAFAGIPPTGQAFTISGIVISRIASGKIAEDWNSYDALGMLRQFDVLPAAEVLGGV